jgi:hypothetical protein
MSAPEEIIILDDSSIESELGRGRTIQEAISIDSTSGSTSSHNDSRSRTSPANNARVRASRTHTSNGTNQDGSDETSYQSSDDDLNSSSSDDDRSSTSSALPDRGKGPSNPQHSKKQETRRWTRTKIIEIFSSSNSDGEEDLEQEHNFNSPANSKTFPSGPVADEDDRKMPARSSRMDASRAGKRDERTNKNKYRPTSSSNHDHGLGEGTPKHPMTPMHRASRQHPASGNGLRNSKFQECPICSKLIPKQSIIQHAAACGEDQFPEGDNTNTEGPRKARKPPKMPLRHVPSASVHSAPVHPVNGPATSPKNGKNTSQLSRNRKKPPVQQWEQRNEKQDSCCNDDNSSKMVITVRPKEAGYSGTKRKLFNPNSAEHERKSSREACTVGPSFVPVWKKRIEEKLRDVRCERKSRKSELMKNALNTKNSLVGVQRQRETHCQISSNHYPTIVSVDHVELNSICAKQDNFPLPRDNTTTVFVRKHFQPVEDEPDTTDSESDPNSAAVAGANLSPSRYCLDESNHFDDGSIEFKAGEKVGAGYEEEETDEDIDKVLEMIHGLDHSHRQMRAYLAHIMQEPEKRIEDRFRATNGVTTEKKKKSDRSQYEEAMSSFRDLFCRRCCIYDCNLHGLAENYDPGLQGELALQSELNANWKVRRGTLHLLFVQGCSYSVLFA